VIVQPNGMLWGSADHVRRVLDRLALQERAHAEIGPDPADGSGYITYRNAGAHTVPYASYVMHLVTYFVRFADLIVTVEGWMMHAAYCLGKRYRVLMLPHSPTEWLPYGRTVHQDVVVQRTFGRASPPRGTAEGDPPLAEKPRKYGLLFALGSLGRTGDAAALPLLRRALRSEDADVRLAAAQSLNAGAEPTVDTDLLALLEDRYAPVRATAAGALLERADDSAACAAGARREHLFALRWIGQPSRDWVAVLRLGEAASEAVRVALNDDNAAIRREAAQVLEILDRRSKPARRLASLKALISRTALAVRRFGRRPARR
jgi:hypothetical protein